MPSVGTPQIIITAPEFELGDCSVVWEDVVISVGANVLYAFELLCMAFTVFNIKCSSSDKLFYSFFAAAC